MLISIVCAKDNLLYTQQSRTFQSSYEKLSVLYLYITEFHLVCSQARDLFNEQMSNAKSLNGDLYQHTVTSTCSSLAVVCRASNDCAQCFSCIQRFLFLCSRQFYIECNINYLTSIKEAKSSQNSFNSRNYIACTHELVLKTKSKPDI